MARGNKHHKRKSILGLSISSISLSLLSFALGFILLVIVVVFLRPLSVNLNSLPFLLAISTLIVDCLFQPCDTCGVLISIQTASH
eukprot:m.27652 g.27652  ORF g.27652 m.27652 type:complete len:85 (+) comp10295_c0_seq1:218-472(+)